LPQAEKSVGAAENLFLLLMQQRECIVGLFKASSELEGRLEVLSVQSAYFERPKGDVSFKSNTLPPQTASKEWAKEGKVQPKGRSC
jgi:hypothetical protein